MMDRRRRTLKTTISPIHTHHSRPRYHHHHTVASTSNSNGDFDPDPLMEGGGGEAPPPADMLARIFQGAQARRASSGEGGDWAR